MAPPVASMLSSQRKLEVLFNSAQRWSSIWTLAFAFDLKSKSFRTPAARGFISFWKAQKETKQRKTLFPQVHKLAADTALGFSDSASCLGRKTAGIHARRPPGLRIFRVFVAKQPKHCND
ncbi:MAG TPA: hypothetical protein PLD19_04860 [Luteimonas sp.]|nr:hypothetical protein [Luteimonas sp.]